MESVKPSSCPTGITHGRERLVAFPAIDPQIFHPGRSGQDRVEPLGKPFHRFIVSNESRCERHRRIAFTAGWAVGWTSPSFQALAETTLALEKGKPPGGIANGPSQIWLPGPDSNQRPSG
jgi:hypothetical protein